MTTGGVKVHTGQWAEDVLIRKIVGHIIKGRYLDLGAYHPFIHSNTAGLWLKGWSGVNVDANPNSIRLFEQTRSEDINIWAAVLPANQIDDNRKIMLSIPDTQDNKQGISAKGSCQKDIIETREMTKKIEVPALSVAEIIEKSNIDRVDYLNVDIEGLDEAILKEFDFKLYRPLVISVEDYARNIHEIVASEITQHMLKNDYELVARAGPTSIFGRSNH